MSYALLAKCGPSPEQRPCAHPPARAEVICMPELNTLMKLRDALLVLKGPLANSPGVRDLLEQRLLSNEVHERVLGKLARPVSSP
jgi:type VI secretion system protein ImpB